jgi:hypothetical protein
MEEKVFVAKLVRYFSFTSTQEAQTIPKLSEMVLRPRDGVNVRAAPRRPLP